MDPAGSAVERMLNQYMQLPDGRKYGYVSCGRAGKMKKRRTVSGRIQDSAFSIFPQGCVHFRKAVCSMPQLLPEGRKRREMPAGVPGERNSTIMKPAGGVFLFPKAICDIYAVIASADGLKAREIAAKTGLEKSEINHILACSPLIREMCFQDHEYRWHAFIRNSAPHDGLYEFSGWYGTVGEFLGTDMEQWMFELQEGCKRIGRSLNDNRGLLHSFRDCRQVMCSLFADLSCLSDQVCDRWEIAFEMRFNRARYIRIYSDVLVITGDRVFVLEFKMKDQISPEEVSQAGKYVPYLEILFGNQYDVIPALILTRASDLFEYVPMEGTDAVIPVCSGDMLFNVFNEYIGFLPE